MTRFSRLASQSSKQENGAPSNPASKEIALVPSSRELMDELLRQGEELINERMEEKARADVQRKINAHYFSLAEKVFEELWKKCGKRTGHTYARDSNNEAGYEDPARTCKTCGHPTGRQTRVRRDAGIKNLAVKLREADKEAGIEYIPN